MTKQEELSAIEPALKAAKDSERMAIRHAENATTHRKQLQEQVNSLQQSLATVVDCSEIFTGTSQSFDLMLEFTSRPPNHITSPAISYSASCPATEDSPAKPGTVTIPTRAGSETLNPGDWLVRDSLGAIRVRTLRQHQEDHLS